MPNVLQIIKGTPYWAWLLLIYLIFVGIEALKDRKVTLFRLAIMPMIFIIWSVFSLYSKTYFALIVYPVAWVVGISLGFLFMQKLNVKVDKASGFIALPGSKVPIILSCSFFLMKYSLGVAYALNPLFKISSVVTGFDAGLSGIFSGFSLSRFLKILHEYRNALSR